MCFKLQDTFYEPKQYSFGAFDFDKRYNIYRPLTYDEYTFNTSIDKYTQTNKFYTPQTYNLFQNTTTKIYDEIAINEFPAIDFNIYQNYQYNFQTTKNISLPSVGQNDTFVTRRFQQTLTNKKIGDDLIVDGRITLTGENDPSTLLCKISPFGFGGGDIIAENNLSCSGILDCSNTSVEHQLGDVYIGRQYSNTSTNYGLSVGSSITDVNNFIISRNEDNNITALNSKDILDLRVLNTQRIRIDNTYSTILNDLVLQKGYLDLYFRNGQSLPNGTIQTVQFGSFSTLPTGFTKNDVGSGYSTQLTNNSGRARTLVMGGSFSINGGTSGFLLIWLGLGSSRLFTFVAPLENGSATVTLSFTYKIGNGQTVFLQCYQNSGATRLVESSANRRGRLFGQVL